MVALGGWGGRVALVTMSDGNDEWKKNKGGKEKKNEESGKKVQKKKKKTKK